TDFRLGYYRYNVIDTKHDQGTEFATQLTIPGINIGGNITSGSPGFNITNLPGGGGGTNGTVYGDGLNVNRCNCPLTEREDQFQIVNNWTREMGNHSIKVGADLRYGRNLRVPSDNDRAGLLNFAPGPTENSSDSGGLGFASFLLGDVTSFNRYVSTSTNAKEFQKRTFFYAQDTWRATHKLTLNLGLRWELYFPETVNGPGNGALLNLNDGYLHVAGIGGIPSDMGWTIDMKKQFAPRIGVTYQLDPKTVIRTGYGRSFDIGVFGSIFGHTVTQNLPVLANQEVSAAQTYQTAFNLAVGPPPNVFPTVPSNGLLPNPGSLVTSKVRQNPLTFPTIDAWNLSVQRALTPTLTLTVAYVGNKGTHTLGDGDNRNTNPNEAAINLPGSYSVNGQALHYDPSVAANVITATGATSTQNFLQRYYGGSLAACKDSNYTTPAEPFVTAGMCGWTQSIFYQGDNQNTEYEALQVTLAQTIYKGLAATVNYTWASAFDENSTYWTWDKAATREPDSNVRKQQMVAYGSYDLPFGKGKQFYPAANRLTDLIIGGYQLSTVLNWSGGLPFGVYYNNTAANVPGSVPNYPSATGRMKTSLTSATSNGGTITRNFYAQQIPCADTAINPSTGKPICSSPTATGDLTDPVDVAAGTGIFKNPGLDNIGNVGYNTYRGPSFFSEDLGLSKAFTIRGEIITKFRFDAFNVFNHINPGNPSGNIESAGVITSEANGCVGSTCGPRQLEFSLRVQF
ncbi:MAG: TonB-dependent receptor, partial [Terracidiphilus sp.]